MTVRTKLVVPAALTAALGAMPSQADDAETLRQMKAQMARMQAQIEAMERRLQEQEVQQRQSEAKLAKEAELPKSETREDRLSDLVQVYGQARVSVDHRSGDWDGDDGTAINSNASRLGVKGGLATSLPDIRLIYQAELRYETTDFVNGGPGSDTDTKQVEFREAYAGLQGDSWGKLRLGRLNTGYKKTGTTIDPWTDNAPQARSGGRQGMSELHSSYFNNAADYETPKFFGGLSATGWYATRFDDTNKPLHNTGTLRRFIGGQAGGAGAKYDNGTIFVAADWLDIDAEEITRAGLANGDAWQVAGRYTLGPFKGKQKLSASAFYEDADDLGLGTNLYGNLIYYVDKFRIIGAYGQNRDGVVYGEKDWNNWSVGVKYALTKKSELLAAWNQRIDDTDNRDFNTLTVGVNAKFGY